ncbi:MAG: glycoside hydrolase family 2 TIM barrel-domain containing protein [Chitinispirillaceae bacterium]
MSRQTFRIIFRIIIIDALSAGFCFFTVQGAPFAPQTSHRTTINFDRGWLYDSTDNAAFSAASYPADSSWSKVCLPHSNKIVKHMYCNGGDTSGSVYGEGAEWEFNSWYRKHYTPPPSYSGLRFLLLFEAVGTVATVYVNGTQVGVHSGAYTPFTLDITNQLVTGKDNVIAVQVNSQFQPNLPPEGGGIDYALFGGIVRNVYLIVTPPLYTEYNFVYMQNCSTANCSQSGIVTSQAAIKNAATVSKKCTVITSIVDNLNNVVATGSAAGTIAAGDSAVLTTKLSQITNLRLWSVDTPYLYSVYTQVMDSTAYVDQFNDTTGFRSIYFGNKTAANCAFYLNGKPLKLFGLDRHETYPFFGRAAAPRLQRQDADILKSLGCNCVRCSHYPQAPDFIRRCDQIGIMLIEEVPGWQYLPQTNATWIGNLFQDLKDMIIRDRNHPSLISWGVRVNESADDQSLYQGTNDTARAMDPSRPTYGARMSSGATTQYWEDIWARTSPGATSSGPFPFFAVESCGWEGQVNPTSWSWWPDDSILKTTGNPYGGVPENINTQSDGFTNQYQCGTLGWCAFDYTSPHPNATTNSLLGARGQRAYISPFGCENTFRIPKFSAYVFQSQRNPALYGPMVFIASDWTAASPATVTVLSNCDSVQLFLNGVSKGTQTGTDGTGLPHPAFQWNLTYSAGTLKAVGYFGGAPAATHQISTPSAPVQLVLTPDTGTIFDGGDMTRILVSLVDSSGRFVRSRADSISMSATGAGDFIGEARSALEGGQFAFYVKSRDGEAGAITCRASIIGATTIAPGSATVNVVLDTTITGVRSVKPGAIAAQSRTMFKTFMSNKFLVPASAGKNALMSVYDLSGKLLYRKVVSPLQKIDLGKAFGASSAAYIVKFESRHSVQ